MQIKIIGKFLHVAFSAFLIWQSIILIERITVNPPNNINSILVNSLFVNLFITGIFTIVYSFPIYRLLSDRYYHITKPLILKNICNIFKVELFRKFLLITIWRKSQNKKYYFNGTRKGFNEFITYTKRAEFGHGFGFIIVLIINIYLITKVLPLMTITIFTINVLFNLYPFLLQRYHRLRLNKILKYTVANN